MKKRYVLIGLVVFLFGNITFAYSPFTKEEHHQIDRQLNQAIPSVEKKEKSEFFSRLAQKSLAIRKAFLPIKMKLYGPKLTQKDQEFIKNRVATLTTLPEVRRNEILEELKKTQQLSEEISRALQIEANKEFEGYARTVIPTPLFRLPVDNVDLNKILWWKGTTGMKVDGNNMIIDLAVVLPPDTPVTLMRKIEKDGFTYYQVRTREFDAGRGAKVGYFLDARYIQKTDQKNEEKSQILPSFEEVIDNLLATSGTAYIWWGTWYQGVPENEHFFPSQNKLSSLEKKRKLMKGVDCSGLLYQATNGYTPRNSRSLLNFWEAVEIEWKTVEQIAMLLKPLDIIVRDGHVVVVLDEKRTIESRGRGKNPGGVEIVEIKKRLEEIFKTRKPVNNYSASSLPKAKKFVVRRWFK